MAKLNKEISVLLLVGKGKDLRYDVLPTKQDILRYYLWLNKTSSIILIIQKVMDIWRYARIKTVSSRVITKYLTKLHKEYRTLNKTSIKRRNLNFQRKVDNFKNNSRLLFDIAACKCKKSCSCDDKMPLDLFYFLEDQRTTRKMKIN